MPQTETKAGAWNSGYFLRSYTFKEYRDNGNQIVNEFSQWIDELFKSDLDEDQNQYIQDFLLQNRDWFIGNIKSYLIFDFLETYQRTGIKSFSNYDALEIAFSLPKYTQKTKHLYAFDKVLPLVTNEIKKSFTKKFNFYYFEN